MDEPNRSSPDATVAQFLTTEHFNLQTERAVANADINARMQLYMSSLSATIITLALATQFSGGGDAFLVRLVQPRSGRRAASSGAR